MQLLTNKRAAYVMDNWGVILPMYFMNAQNWNTFEAMPGQKYL